MQLLYAYFHSEEKNSAKHQQELFFSFENVYDLYLYLLLLLAELRQCGQNLIGIRKNKKLPTEDDLHPSTKFIDNSILNLLSTNEQLVSETAKRKLTWENDRDIVQKVFLKITKNEEYKTYMSSPSRTFEEDKKFVCRMYGNHIVNDELLNIFFEEKNIHWTSDMDYVHALVLKTLLRISESKKTHFILPALYKNEKEDKSFASGLFTKVIEQDAETNKMIRKKTENWELERIAFMDNLLMKMAIAEFLSSPSIPVKVTLNEYIELAKEFSTLKSSVFINGILDKLLADFRKDGMLQKQGRGLVEN